MSTPAIAADSRPLHPLSGVASALAVVAVAVGCSWTPPSSASPPDSPNSLGSPTPQATTAPPAPTLAAPPLVIDGEVALGCGGLVFPSAVLSSARGVETADHPAAEVLQAAIADRAVRSGAGWRLAVLTDDQALFLLERTRPNGTATWWRALFVHDAQWSLEDAGTCELQPAYPDGFGPAMWELADGEPIGPATTSFAAAVTELACASGQSADGRLAAPAIAYEQRAVIVYFGVRELGGDQHCQGNPATNVTVELREPLGDRALFDGGTFPPTMVAEP